MIHTLVAAGIDYHTARNMPTPQAFRMMACHWQSNGIHIERMACKDHGFDLGFDREERFQEIRNREKSWPLEQL
jgi:hypothetical protein